MRIGVIHDSLNYAGGAERVCLKTIEALKEAGHYVILASIERTNWENVSRTFGPILRPDEEVYLFQQGFTSLRFYVSLLSPIILYLIRDRCDSTICTAEELMLLRTDFGYMHFLPISLLKSGLHSGGKSTVGFYSLPFKLLQKRKLKSLEEGQLVANSVFTQDALERAFGRKATVVYPPVDVERLTPLMEHERLADTALTVGRYSPEKNFELVLSLAELLPATRFVIIGNFSGAISVAYYRRLLRIKEAKRLNNITLLHDQPYSRLATVLASSSLFVSATINEHFGVAIVEGMAAGLVPIVHRSGGPWKDILGEEQGLYGFSYADAAEAAGIISELKADRGKVKDILSRNRERSRAFSETIFKSKMVELFSVRRRNASEVA